MKTVFVACKFVEKEFDNTINWEERERELKELCDKHRKNNGEYDCLIGGSGGKDSVFNRMYSNTSIKMIL